MNVNPGVVGSAGHECDPLLFNRVVVTAEVLLGLLIFVAPDAGPVSRASCTVPPPTRFHLPAFVSFPGRVYRYTVVFVDVKLNA